MLDFEKLKATLSIEAVAKSMGLALKEGNGQFRSSCPACQADDPRTVVYTPSKGLWYCFKSKKGGDVIALRAHMMDISMKEAAEQLAEAFSVEKKKPDDDGELQPLGHIDHEHALVQTIGFEPDFARSIGIGFASKGLMRNYVAVPIRTPTGLLVGYIGLSDPDSVKLPPKWRTA